MMFKKILASLISLNLSIPLKMSAYEFENTDFLIKPQVSPKIECNLGKIGFDIFTYSSDACTGLEIFGELEYKKEMYVISRNFSEKYKENLIDCQITKKQEGKMWCWLACLQGLLKHFGIEKSQKEIFMDIKNHTTIPFLECSRNTGLSIYGSKEIMKLKGKSDYTINHTVFPNMIKNYVEKISNEKFTYQIIYLDPNSNENDLQNSIYDAYVKIGKHPFSLLANRTSSCHFVNIRKIDSNGYMYIEDPAFGKGRIEPINEYVQNFDFRVKRTVQEAEGILLGFISEK